MSNIDKHAVQAVADLKAGYTLGHADVAILNELARIALASLEAEPAIHRWRRVTVEPYGPYPWHYGNFIGFSKPVEGIEDEYFYSAPPAPVSVPDAYVRDERGRMMLNGRQEPRIGYGAGWNGYRAAMLQGAEPVTTAYKLPDDFDFDRFNDVVWLETVASNPHMHSLTTSTIAMVALELNRKLAAGNSPVIPDGWVMVPVEPTEDMIVNGFESEPDESFSDEKEWEAYEAMSGCQQAAHRAKLCWAAMIAAAPQQEVNNG
jgi:hypothetical protein